MSEQPDGETVAAWFMSRQLLLLEVIEGARYDPGERAEALRDVVGDLKGRTHPSGARAAGGDRQRLAGRRRGDSRTE